MSTPTTYGSHQETVRSAACSSRTIRRNGEGPSGCGEVEIQVQTETDEARKLRTAGAFVSYALEDVAQVQKRLAQGGFDTAAEVHEALDRPAQWLRRAKLLLA